MFGLRFIANANQNLSKQNAKLRNWQSGVAPREHYLGWEIEINKRAVGVTIARDLFSATLRNDATNAEEYLSGFSSHEAAVSAARRKIDRKLSTQQFAAMRPLAGSEKTTV